MAIWIRTVDPQWFDFVSSRPEMAEVNLWTPAGRRFLDGAETGDLVLFRVKGRRGIAGCGLFFNAAIYFAADAWDIFGEGNGAETREAFGEQIRAKHTAKGSGFYPLGCHDIVEPVYFTGRRHRLPEDAVQHLPAGPIDEGSVDGTLILDFLEGAISSEAGELMEVSRRLRDREGRRRRVSAGRSGFQIAVHNAYGRICAITGVAVLPALEAVHVIADRFGGRFDVRNGMLFRRDLHPLFEQGYMTVSADHRVLFSVWLPRAYPNCETYLAFNGRRLRLPKRRDLWPDPDLLARHRAFVFFKGGAIQK